MTAVRPQLAEAPLASSDAETTLQLPAPGRLIPAVTARRFRRWGKVYLAAAAIALLATALGAPPSVRVFTAGLPLPGGAFLASGHPVLFVASLLAVFVAVFAWWAVGVSVLPPVVWFTAAIIGGALATASPTPAALAGALATIPVLALVALTVHRLRFARQVRAGREINAELETVRFTITGPPTLERASSAGEHTAEDLAFQRYALDLALQPVDEFAGFVQIDQFREAALRYQCYLLGYALSMGRYTRTPAFSGYLEEAQRNAIEKVLDRRVWGYWATENAWGRLSGNHDPVNTPGNIMLTGYHGTMVGMYEVFGDDRFSHRGGLTYRWSEGEAYENDFRSITASIHRNMTEADYTLFPCEPNWIFSVCNAAGLNAMVSHDQLHGTDFAGSIGPRLHQAFETEFLRPDGQIIGVRSNHTGLSWNFWTGEAIQLTSAYWLHAGFPDLAQRAWWLLRRRSLSVREGQLILPRAASNRLDPGNYSLGRDGYAQATAMMTAREMGDEEIARAAQESLEATYTARTIDGARSYQGLSTLTSLFALLGRFGRESGMRDLVAHGLPETWQSGPRLTGAAYPEVLVARAISDGAALDLVLRPGAGALRTTLEIDRLTPGGDYGLAGAVADRINADSRGTARFEVDLGDRLAVRVYPLL
jgi:hypothetical protein